MGVLWGRGGEGLHLFLVLHRYLLESLERASETPAAVAKTQNNRCLNPACLRVQAAPLICSEPLRGLNRVLAEHRLCPRGEQPLQCCPASSIPEGFTNKCQAPLSQLHLIHR